MPVIPFGEYRPDISDRNTGDTAVLANVLPRGDGYGPFFDAEALTEALGAQCRGYFFARRSDGSVAIFAATSTRIYLMNNTTFTWSDVSKGGTDYSGPDSDRNWRFAQFNNFVFATNRNDAVQVYNLSSSSAFADLGGSPPQAGYIAVVNRFVVLCDLLDNPYRIQWSGLNDTTEWTSGTNYSDYQDLPTGGLPKAVLGGEFGVILQDTEVRRMTFAAGSEIVFQIEKIADSLGVVAAESAVAADNRFFFYSTKGFIEMSVDGSIRPIGLERVDRTFKDTLYDDTAPQYLVGAADPTAGVVLWSYRDKSSTADGFTSVLGFNYNLNRWGPPVVLAGEYLATLAQPGLTLEGVDGIAPGAATISNAADNGSGLIRLTVSSSSGWATDDYKTISGVAGTTEANGTWQITVINSTTIDLQGSTFSNAYSSGGLVGGSVDALTVSLDSLSSETLSKLSVANQSHEIGFFAGASLEATLAVAEQHLDQGHRVDVNGLRPMTDAATVYGRIGTRDNLNASVSYSDEVVMNDDGFVPALVNTRLARGSIRIPAGETWTFASGLEPMFERAGMY